MAPNTVESHDIADTMIHNFFQYMVVVGSAKHNILIRIVVKHVHDVVRPDT